MKVWLVTAFEPIPIDQIRPMRFMGIADRLFDNGHELTIWTSTFTPHNNKHRYNEDTFLQWKENYHLAILKSKGYEKKVSLQRYLAHLDFARRLRDELPKSNTPDLIYISLPPIDTVVEVIKYARKRGIPVVVDIIDPWPDVFLQVLPKKLKFLGKAIFFPFYLQLKFIFKNVSGLVAISEKYKNWGLEYSNKKIPAATFYPAVDLRDDSVVISKAKNNDIVRFVYAGSLSTSYDVETIISVAQRLSTEGNFEAEFIIAGQGHKFEHLKTIAEGLKNVSFTGFLGKEKLNEVLLSSDIGIACYVKNSSQSVTYKLFDYLSAGLPIVCSLPGEMSDLIEKYNVGYYYEPQNVENLYSVIKHILKNKTTIYDMKIKALNLTKELGDSNVVYRKLVKFLEQFHSRNL